MINAFLLCLTSLCPFLPLPLLYFCLVVVVIIIVYAEQQVSHLMLRILQGKDTFFIKIL